MRIFSMKIKPPKIKLDAMFTTKIDEALLIAFKEYCKTNKLKQRYVIEELIKKIIKRPSPTNQ